jgi:hypothetical protein
MSSSLSYFSMHSFLAVNQRISKHSQLVGIGYPGNGLDDTPPKPAVHAEIQQPDLNLRTQNEKLVVCITYVFNSSPVC